MNSDSGKDVIINYKSGKGVNIAARKESGLGLPRSGKSPVLTQQLQVQAVKERSRQLLNERQRAEHRKGHISLET